MSILERLTSLFCKSEDSAPTPEPIVEESKPAANGDQIHIFVQGTDYTNKSISLHLWANSMEEGLKTARTNPNLKSITDLTVMPKVELIQKCIKHRNKGWLAECFSDANNGLVSSISTSELFAVHKGKG
jgi:hypothetical protein